MHVTRSLSIVATMLVFAIGSSMAHASAKTAGQSGPEQQTPPDAAPPKADKADKADQGDNRQSRRQPVSALSVLSKHARGMGGSLIWEEMGRIELHLTLINRSGEHAHEYDAIMIMEGPERLRWIQHRAGDTTTHTVRNGAFTWIEGGPMESRRYIRRPSVVAEARYKAAHVNSWVAQLGLWFGQIELGGFVDVNDERCIRLYLRNRLDGLTASAPDENDQHIAYFSEETGRLIRITFPPVGRLYDAYYMQFSDWKTFGPVTVATRIEEHIGEQLRVTVVRNVRIGDDIEVTFDVPDAVRTQPEPAAPGGSAATGFGAQRPARPAGVGAEEERRGPQGAGGSETSGGNTDGPKQPDS